MQGSRGVRNHHIRLSPELTPAALVKTHQGQRGNKGETLGIVQSSVFCIKNPRLVPVPADLTGRIHHATSLPRPQTPPLSRSPTRRLPHRYRRTGLSVQPASDSKDQVGFLDHPSDFLAPKGNYYLTLVPSSEISGSNFSTCNRPHPSAEFRFRFQSDRPLGGVYRLRSSYNVPCSVPSRQ